MNFLNQKVAEVIDPNSIRHFFGMSTWESFVSFAFVILITITLWIIFKKKGKSIAILSSLLIGGIGIVVFGAIYNQNPLPPTITEGDVYWVDEANQWLGLYGSLFIGLISIVIPIYLFVIIVTLILNSNSKTLDKKTYMFSFGTMIGLSILGMLIAILMIPILILIPKDFFNYDVGGDTNDITTTLPGIIISGANGSLSIFTSLEFVLSIAVFAFIFGFAIKLYEKDKGEEDQNVKQVFNTMQGILIKYMSMIIVLIPFAISTKLASLGLNTIDETSNTLGVMGIYLGVFWFGSIIIYLILFLGNIILGDKNINKKEKSKILWNQTISSFASQSTAVALNKTQANAKKIGVKDEVAKFTPTSGVFMGMVMCNGFTPMLIVMFSMLNYDALTATNILLAFVIILTISISSSGSGSADYTIILTTLGSLGISTSFYTAVILPMQEINEITIKNPNNTMGHLLATQITDKFDNKIRKGK